MFLEYYQLTEWPGVELRGHEKENLTLPLGLPLNLKVNSRSTLLQS